MVRHSFKEGLQRLRRRPGLAGLLYLVNLLFGLVLSVPAYLIMRDRLGATGFGPDRAAHFDVVLWADVLDRVGPALAGLSIHLLWMVPLYVLWKVAASLGVIFALQDSARHSFWRGVRRFIGAGLLLALIYVLILAGWGVLTIVLSLLLSMVWEGEIGTFWINGVIFPALIVLGLALVDMMHDYSRIALTTADQKVTSAWKMGLLWPIRHGAAVGLYALWFVLAAALAFVPPAADMFITVETPAGIWALFILQQLILLLGAAVTTAWLGSEVAFFEQIRRPRLPAAPRLLEAPEGD